MPVIEKDIGTAKTEIGKLEDWKNFTMTEHLGTIGDGVSKMEINRTLNGTGFELWHESGLKMRIDIRELLSDCAAELIAEVNRREREA